MALFAKWFQAPLQVVNLFYYFISSLAEGKQPEGLANSVQAGILYKKPELYSFCHYMFIFVLALRSLFIFWHFSRQCSPILTQNVLNKVSRSDETSSIHVFESK